MLILKNKVCIGRKGDLTWVGESVSHGSSDSVVVARSGASKNEKLYRQTVG